MAKKFEILNRDELPSRTGSDIFWAKISEGTVLKTEHEKYGYHEFVVIKYEEGKLYLKYEGTDVSIDIPNLLAGRIGSLIGECYMRYKHKVGDIVRNLEVTKQIRVGERNLKAYKYKCLKCGFDCGKHYRSGELTEEHYITENNLNSGKGCPCCSNKITVEEINSIWEVAPWMIDLGVSIEDAKKYTRSSSKKIKVICPDCKKEKNIRISDIYINKSIGCPCGKCASYPEKVMASILDQLNLEYFTEITKSTPDGLKSFRYDFYIPLFHMIIETHGVQHYKDSGRGRTLKEEQGNDFAKKELALNNGITKYIVIDCRKSDLDFIKENILKSNLNGILDLNSIDWAECEKYALKNKIKEICGYWDNRKEGETTKDLAERFGISKKSVTSYLKKGVKLGWCHYDAAEEARKSGEVTGKPLNVYDENMNYLGTYASAAECERKSLEDFGIQFCKKNVNSTCLGRQKHHKNYIFRFKELKK